MPAPSPMHTFARDEILPSYWVNALGRFEAAVLSNFKIEQASTTSVRVPVATNERASLAVGGALRYVDATVSVAHPGGAAGLYSIWATASAQSIANTPQPNTDNTVYSFALAITSGAAPGTALSRKVGELVWDGAAIVVVRPLLGDPGGVPLVTSIPNSALLPDGFVIAYVADATRGIVWRFRNRPASASARKWEFVGGGWLNDEQDALQPRANAAYGDLATVGPSLTLPLTGDYVLRYGALLKGATGGNTGCFMSPSVGAAAAADADAASAYMKGVADDDPPSASVSRERRKSAVAGDAVVMKYRSDGVGPGLLAGNRFLAIQPSRVS